MKKERIHVKGKWVKVALMIVVGAFITSSCNRDSETFEGPDLNDLYGEFMVLQDFGVSSPSIDFSTGATVFFTAQFSRITDWTIRISHASNGSVKVITGRSRIIDATNATWDGSTTIFPVFDVGSCSAELFVDADSSTHQSSVTVRGTLKPNGTVISDFESAIDPKWNLFVQSGANMSFRTEDKITAPVGSKYFDMGGEVNWDWLIGLFDVPATAMGSNGFDLTSNPDDLYFNVVLNRPDSLPNGFVLFRFSEDENGDGNFNESSEDQYAVEIRDFDPGWNIVSIKYSDLQFLVNGVPTDPNGNGVKNPDKLHTVSCLFLADPNSGYAQVLMDYMVFTTGGPLKL